MVIADLIYILGNTIIAISLLPSIFSVDKPHLKTCLITTAVLLAFSYALFTEQLWWAAGTTLLVVSGWVTLTIQQLLKRNEIYETKS